MTQEATSILLYAGSQMSLQEQEDFSVYFAKLLEEHYHPKEITVTGKTMEAILENWEQEKATAK